MPHECSTRNLIRKCFIGITTSEVEKCVIEFIIYLTNISNKNFIQVL